LAETRIILLTALRRELAALRHAVPATRMEVIGPGGGNLHAIEKLREPGWLVVLAGLAGALDPRLKIGDVIVDGGGKIFTSPNIVVSPAQKTEMFARTGSLAVDMEGDAVRAWANSMQAGFLHVRAISDRADQVIDPAYISLVTPSGGTRWAAAIGYAISHPARIAAMMRMAGESKLALQNLARELAALQSRHGFSTA